MEPLRHDDPRHVGPYVLIGRLEAALDDVSAVERRYLARPVSGDRTVQLTTPLGEFDQDTAYAIRFRAEAERARGLAGRIRWLTPATEVSGERERPVWHACPYRPGLSLPEALVAYGGPLPERTVRALGAAVAEALAQLHTAGLAHAGLTPWAVLVGDQPRITGFGAVRAVAPDGQDRTGLPGLVAQCTAPEQLTGGRPRPPGDVYALGAVLSYAATGRLAAPPGELPEPLREAVTACLAPDPADRPSAAALLTELIRGAAGDAHAPAGEMATLPGGGPAATVLDRGAGGAASVLGPGWLPGRVVAAMAGQAARVLAEEPEGAEPASAEARHAELEGAEPAGAEATGPSSGPVRPVADRTPAASASAAAQAPAAQAAAGHPPQARPSQPGPLPRPLSGPPHTADTAPAGSAPAAAGAGRRPSRRLLLTGAAAGVAGAALGFGAVTALGVGGGARPARRPRAIRGVPPVPLWEFRLRNAPTVAPAVWRGRIVVLAADSDVFGLALRTGKRLWTAQVVAAGPAIDVGDDLIMIPEVGPPGFLAARSGQLRWQEAKYDAGGAGGELEQVLGVRDGALWFTVHSRDEGQVRNTTSVVAYDVGARRERWRCPLPERFTPKPADPGKRRLVRPLPLGDASVIPEAHGNSGAENTDAKRFVALRGRDGRRLWTKTYDGVALDAVVAPLAPGSALVSDGQGGLRALGLADGAVKWTAQLRSEAARFGTIAVHGTRVYVADGMSAVTALDARTGKVVWHSDPRLLVGGLVEDVQTSVTPSGRTVLAVNSTEIVAFRATDGAILWRFSDVSGAPGGIGLGPAKLLAFGGGVAIALSHKSVYALPVE
ncbi:MULTISPECIES: PQQ-binding-like beta-propeller repeat protein [unclassified Streptomyces]|uniref:outer membrane protein assembly factor BamB family protein n=1 Tax=unclassified Streptomyces TaxID=2593676 RepID=UPI00336A45DC